MDSITQAAIPLFLGLLFVEVIIAYVRKARIYRLNDAVADLALGTMSRMTGLVWAVFLIWVYALVFEHASLHALFGVPHLPDGPLTTDAGVDLTTVLSWSVAFLLVDHQYYWAHRTTHTYNLPWGMHVAHHSSPEFNLAVALRQSGTQSLWSMWFYFPLALVGVTWKHFAICFGINLLYQFWIHTRLIGRMGVLEYVLNTPSHHRVHHGRNPKYIDKNHAGVFIIWDRLYGSFQVEEEEPLYGVTTPLESHNPVWANIHHFAWLLATMRQARGLGDKLRVLYKPTGWRPDYLGGPIVPKEPDPTLPVYSPRISRTLVIYAVLHFALIIAFTLAMLNDVGALLATRAGIAQLVAGSVFAIFSMSNVAGMFDARPWVKAAELGRLVVIGAVAAVALTGAHGDPEVAIGALAVAGVSLLVWPWLVSIRIPARVPRERMEMP